MLKHCCVLYVVIQKSEMPTRFRASSFSLRSSEVLAIAKYFSRCEGKSERLQVQIKQVQIEGCWKARACWKSETGELSGRPVSSNTPSCGWVGAEPIVGQVNRDHSTTSRWTLAYMQFQAYFQASCINPEKGLHAFQCQVCTSSNRRIVQGRPSGSGFHTSAK